MTREITIQITEQQEKFLKLFAEKQYPGSKDNRCTAHPLHIVETKRYNHIPYSDDIAWAMDDLPLVFTPDSDYDRWYEDPVEMVKDWYECRGEDVPMEIKPYREIESTRVETVDGEKIFIFDYGTYFKAYGVHLQAAAWKKEYYAPVAPFFILEEALKYMEYQGHNLTEPRVFTYGAGYANSGDFTHFWQLLMSAGKALSQPVEV